jgi:hypothetical protein
MRHYRPALFALAIAANAFAAPRTFVSAASGNDANPCSSTSPCRSFTAAAALTDADGEIIVIDSGGYGTVIIARAMSIISPEGVYAGVTATTGSAISIDADDTANVILRNLSLNSIGADDGIDAIGKMAALSVEGCTITGFGSDGVAFAPSTSDPRLYVSNTTIRRCGEAGVDVSKGRGTLDSLLLYDNRRNVMAFEAEVVARNCLAKGGDFYGFYSGISAKLVVEDSAASGNLIGFYANLGVMTIARCTSSSNSNGILADNGGTTIYVSDSTITANAIGLGGLGGTIRSRGNNTLLTNTTDGAFTNTYPAQ